MLIDAEQGVVHLPNGFIISSELTTDELLAAPLAAKAYNLSALPFTWFSAHSGMVEDVPLLVELCFRDSLLVHADLHVDLEQERILIEDAEVESVAAQAKAIHERFLDRDLGAPVEARRGFRRHSLLILDTTRVYQYSWGEVISQHNGNTFVRVEYVGRRERPRPLSPGQVQRRTGQPFSTSRIVCCGKAGSNRSEITLSRLTPFFPRGPIVDLMGCKNRDDD